MNLAKLTGMALVIYLSTGQLLTRKKIKHNKLYFKFCRREKSVE